MHSNKHIHVQKDIHICTYTHTDTHILQHPEPAADATFVLPLCSSQASTNLPQVHAHVQCQYPELSAGSPVLLNLVELVGYVLPVLEIHLNQCRSGFSGVGGSSQSLACHAPASTWCPSGTGEAEQDKQPHGQELNRSCWASCSRGWRPKKQPDLGADY